MPPALYVLFHLHYFLFVAKTYFSASIWHYKMIKLSVIKVLMLWTVSIVDTYSSVSSYVPAQAESVKPNQMLINCFIHNALLQASATTFQMGTREYSYILLITLRMLLSGSDWLALWYRMLLLSDVVDSYLLCYSYILLWIELAGSDVVSYLWCQAVAYTVPKIAKIDKFSLRCFS